MRNLRRPTRRENRHSGGSRTEHGLTETGLSDVTSWILGLELTTHSLGVLASFGLMWLENTCTRLSGGSEFCSSVGSNTAKILGLNAAALF